MVEPRAEDRSFARGAPIGQKVGAATTVIIKIDCSGRNIIDVYGPGSAAWNSDHADITCSWTLHGWPIIPYETLFPP
ncbi:MAG TPA: hypothetical protein VK281_17005 [Xanthobacteraceae bacterium]|nr:hypothetical protein [Xanthobacteraceae bacterium]